MNARRRPALRIVLALLALVILLIALVVWLNVRGDSSTHEAPGAGAGLASASVIERGAYLARAGNCMGCHTVTGGASFAGGRGVDTPFGVVMAPNITPHAGSGIGSWTATDFWQAMLHGRSKDGRLLYPAFPYPSFTYVSREDSDALFAYLRSMPAIDRANEAHDLKFPYSTQAALAVWRALYFSPGEFQPERSQSAEWNRGKYLVQGLGHCAACHSGRNVLGGTSLNTEFAGGLMPDASWYAPSLASPHEAGVQRWQREEVVKLLKNGVAADASVSGPMAEVVFSGTQYMSQQDLSSMAQYLAAIPVRQVEAPPRKRAEVDVFSRGGKIYSQHCAACHGDAGQGVAGLYPALAGNRAVTLVTTNNVVQMIRHGGFAPTTTGNPRPFGMPPYGQALNDQEIAAVATYIRQSWGNTANPVSPLDVLRVN